MPDPFTLLVAKQESFCDRTEEKAELHYHIKNKHNVVLSAKRKMGKTSLVEQVFNEAREQDILTVYSDVFSVSSEKDFVSIFASAIVEGVGRGATDTRSFMEKVGALFTKIVPSVEVKPDGTSISVRYDKNAPTELLLEDILDGLYKDAERKQQYVTVCLDEFQEIARLKDSKKIEGTLRSRIQFGGNVNFIFAGSRRGILNDMFTGPSRPLYKITYPMMIAEIPRADFVSYIGERFNSTGKVCPPDAAGLIYDSVVGHTYYVQKLASLSWSLTDSICDQSIVHEAHKSLLKMEVATEIEGIWRGLSLGQKSLMKALAKEPTKTPYSLEFSTGHDLPIATIRRALQALVKEDHVELKANGEYALTNPVFKTWLEGMPSRLDF